MTLHERRRQIVEPWLWWAVYHAVRRRCAEITETPCNADCAYQAVVLADGAVEALV